jgi:hypothetical protein
MKRSTGHHQSNRRLGKASQQASASVQARALFKADTDCFPLSVFRVGIASGQEHPIVGLTSHAGSSRRVGIKCFSLLPNKSRCFTVYSKGRSHTPVENGGLECSIPLLVTAFRDHEKVLTKSHEPTHARRRAFSRLKKGGQGVSRHIPKRSPACLSSRNPMSCRLGAALASMTLHFRETKCRKDQKPIP